MKRRNRKRKRCPKCKQVKKLTKHHLIGKRHGGHNSKVVKICRDCHDSYNLFEIEVETKNFTEKGTHRLSNQEYVDLFYSWILG